MTAATELMSRLYLNLFRYCDIVVVDALYAVAPFINTVLEQNKDILVKKASPMFQDRRDATEKRKDRGNIH